MSINRSENTDRLLVALGAAIQATREGQGRSRADVAVAIRPESDATRESKIQWLYQIERGRNVSARTVVEIAYVLDVPASALLYRAESNTPLSVRGASIRRLLDAVAALPDLELADLARIAERMRPTAT